MSEIVLETPTPSDLMYMSRGDEVDAFRPLFTGDIYAKRDSNGEIELLVVVLQHPCALRVRGVELVPEILAARISTSGKPRSDWANESIRVMPVPDLFQDGAYYAADLVDIVLIPSSELVTTWERVAILSELGVNLLTQRWVNHNSRVVIKTVTYNEQTAGPFHEADLEAEWRMMLEDVESQGESAEFDFHEWIRRPWGSGVSMSRQSLLDDPQKRAGVRRAMNDEIRARRLMGAARDS